MVFSRFFGVKSESISSMSFHLWRDKIEFMLLDGPQLFNLRMLSFHPASNDLFADSDN